MSFHSFCQRGCAPRFATRQFVPAAPCLRLRSRVRDRFASIPDCGPVGDILHESYPSSVCMIRRRPCFEDRCEELVVGQSTPYWREERRQHWQNDWQKIGYLLPLYANAAPSGTKCTCNRLHYRRQNHYRQSSRSSQFGQARAAPQHEYGEHEPHCPLAANHSTCTNRNCGARRYHLYVRTDPDRVGQRCVQTGWRGADHRRNNCRYLQFGVAEEGLHHSAIMILTSDYVVGSHPSSNFVSRNANQCLENGDVVFVPSEQEKKFVVHLYDDSVYDGHCGYYAY